MFGRYVREKRKWDERKDGGLGLELLHEWIAVSDRYCKVSAERTVSNGSETNKALKYTSFVCYLATVSHTCALTSPVSTVLKFKFK